MSRQRRNSLRLMTLESRVTPAVFFAETTDELIRAILDANANPGSDTIELTGRNYVFGQPFESTRSALPAIDLLNGSLTIRAFDDPATDIDNFRVVNFTRSSSVPFRFLEADGRSIFFGGTLKVDRINFENGGFGKINEVGGAVAVNNASLEVTRCTFQRNTAAIGGAIYLNGVSTVSDRVFISQTTFNSNDATDIGGAVYLKSTALDMVNSTFFSNRAAKSGGAIFLDESNSTIRFSTLTNNISNTPDSGGAVRVVGGSARIVYSVVTTNTNEDIVSSVTVPIDFSMLNSKSDKADYQAQFKIAPTNSVFSDAPGLRPFAFYGGFNRTRLPDQDAKAPNSVIDLIPLTVPLFTTVDQRDQRRPDAFDSKADIGAVELQLSENVGTSFGSDVAVQVAFASGTQLKFGDFVQFDITVDNFGPFETAVASVSNTVEGLTIFSWIRSDFPNPQTALPDGGQQAGSDIVLDQVLLPAQSRVVYTVEAEVTTKTGPVGIWAYVTNQEDADPNLLNNAANFIIPVIVDTTVDPPGLEGNRIVIGSDAGYAPNVRVFDPANGNILADFLPYGQQFRGGVRTAAADITGDGTADIIVAPGPGGGPHVKIYDGKSFGLIREFFAYDPRFTGGLYIAAADVTGDGVPDIITGAGAGGGPNVRVFDGVTLEIVADFFAYAPNFRGGVHVGAGDVNNDGRSDIVTGPGVGGGPHVRVFDVSTLEILSVMAYDPAFTGGVWVAAGDFNRDGYADIVTGAGQGGGAHVKIFDGNTGGLIAQQFAFDERTGNRATTVPQRGFDNIIARDRFNEHKNGVRVAVTSDLNFDGRPEIVASSGPGDEPVVRILSPLNVTGPDSITLNTITRSNNSPVAVAPFAASSSPVIVSGVTGQIGNPATIADVNVRVSIQAADSRDLVISLLSPDGTRVELAANVGKGGPNFIDTRFDDESPNSIKAAKAPFTGTFRPVLPLSIFDGLTAINGTWLLEVRNTTNNGPATISNWSLEVAVGNSSTKVALYDVYDFRALRDLNLLSPYFSPAQTSFGQTSPIYPEGRDSLLFPGYANAFFGGIYVGAT